MADHRVLVVIPAFNAARFLRATLDGLQDQTFREFETIVVDDGSRDETSEIAHSYPAVRVIRQENAGVAAARNRGVRETRSEWLAFLDADDLWMPEKLDLQLECARNLNAGAVFTDLRIIDVHGDEVSPSPAPVVSLEMASLLLHSETIPQGTSSTLLVKRSVFEAIGGYDESLATMADWDLLIRLREATTFAHVPKKLVAYRRYSGSMSGSVAMLERESLFVLNKVFGRTDLPREWRQLETRSRAWNDMVLSGSHFGAGNFRAAVHFALRSVGRDPSLLARVAGAPFRRLRRMAAPSL